MTETEELDRLIKRYRQTPDDDELFNKIIAIKRRLGIEQAPALVAGDYDHARHREETWPDLLRREAEQAATAAQWSKQQFYNTLAYRAERIRELEAAIRTITNLLEIKTGR